MIQYFSMIELEVFSLFFLFLSSTRSDFQCQINLYWYPMSLILLVVEVDKTVVFEVCIEDTALAFLSNDRKVVELKNANAKMNKLGFDITQNTAETIVVFLRQFPFYM